MLFSLLFCISGAWAQESQSTLDLSGPEQVVEVRDKAYEVEFKMELRAQRDRRDRAQTNSAESVHEISLGGRYEVDRRVGLNLEISVEQLEGETKFFAKQAFVDWEPWADRLRILMGQQFVPVGLIGPRDNWFSSNPPFMQRIFAASRGIDLGAVVDVLPLPSEVLYLQGGSFAGRPVRAGDQRKQAPEKAPRVLSLKSRSEFHEAFATFYEHDLAFFDPVKAWGAGAQWDSPGWRDFQLSLLAEYWRFDQIQRVGPTQRNLAWIGYAQLKWWRLKTGYRFSESQGEMMSALARDRLPLEASELWLVAVNMTKEFSLQAERVIETQNEVLRDEWVARALVDWRF